MAQAFAKEFTVFVNSLNKNVSEKIAAAAHAGEAKITSDQSGRRGDTPGVIHAVDGDQSKAFEQVKPNGQIVLLFDYRVEIIHAGFQELVARSPIISGEYRCNHFAMLDGEGLEPMTIPTFEEIKSVKRITLTNNVPYSARLEHGITESGGYFIKQKDPHIFEGAMEVLRREFGAVATFTFQYIDLDNAYMRRTNFALRRGKNRKRRAGSVIQYPAIHIDRL